MFILVLDDGACSFRFSLHLLSLFDSRGRANDTRKWTCVWRLTCGQLCVGQRVCENERKSDWMCIVYTRVYVHHRLLFCKWCIYIFFATWEVFLIIYFINRYRFILCFQWMKMNFVFSIYFFSFQWMYLISVYPPLFTSWFTPRQLYDAVISSVYSDSTVAQCIFQFSCWRWVNPGGGYVRNDSVLFLAIPRNFYSLMWDHALLSLNCKNCIRLRFVSINAVYGMSWI